MYDVRPMVLEDAAPVARVHVQVWREAYDGVMPAGFLAGLDESRVAEGWRGIVARHAADQVLLVALDDDEVVAFGSAGPSRDPQPPNDCELHAINLVAATHGTGLADRLMAGLVGDRPAHLWVVEANARARAFYTRHGFAPDGATGVHEATGVGEIRLVRS